jgi:F-type H+-transporting ATPase subunit gamma
MASLRTIRRRITSVKNTQQITRAMKMIAAARLKKAQDNLMSSRPYSTKMKDTTESLVARTDTGTHPLLERREKRRAVLLVISSDRGLCGAFNANIFREAVRFLKAQETETSLVLIGRKAQEFFKRREFSIKKEYKDIYNDFSFENAVEVGTDITGDYEKGEIDSVFMIYNYFESILSQNTTLSTLLPIGSEKKETDDDTTATESEKESASVDFICEPSQLEILNVLLPRFINTQIYRALLESMAGEYSARMTAMDAATENAAELIESLTLTYNKARQASITKELIEVVSGADAMQG